MQTRNIKHLNNVVYLNKNFVIKLFWCLDVVGILRYHGNIKKANSYYGRFGKWRGQISLLY